MRQKGQNDGSEVSGLLRQLREGDAQSFERLSELYAPLIASLVGAADEQYRKYGSEYEDLRQEASLALYRAAMSYRLDQSEVTFGLYAKICVRNRLISAGRRLIRHYNAQKAVAQRVTQPLDTARQGVAVIPDLSALSDYERRIYSLYIQGLSYARIAEELGRPEKSVDNAIYRIRRKLRRQKNQSNMPK